MLHDQSRSWSKEDSESLYAINRWGDDFLSIGENGQLRIHPKFDSDISVELMAIVEQLKQQGTNLPLLIRFNDLLEKRMLELGNAFSSAMTDHDYRGDYSCVYPIKVNQQRQVVEQIASCGGPMGFGLEAGSKAELLAVLAISDSTTPIICNGFKDARYIETAVMSMKMGRQITVVIERYSELPLLLQLAQQNQVRPNIGMRVKLAARSAGRWQASGGYHSKFGLTVGEILTALKTLEEGGMADCFQLLHFHLGSQIPDIRHIKAALTEASRVYAELIKQGAGLTTLDVGGGLGIDYDGSQSNHESSVNYTLQEYANDVIFHVQQVCDAAGVPHPNIISESGRAIVSHHSALVVNVVGSASQVSEKATIESESIEAVVAQPIRNMRATLNELCDDNLLQSFHDGQQSLDNALTLFGLGHLTLADRSLAESSFWRLCRQISERLASLEQIPDELQNLDELLTQNYICNFSVFQSLPDSWAIGQLFPIIPIHRLDEKPEFQAVLGDITCDSDGKIQRFVVDGLTQPRLPVHRYRPTEPYYLAIFLVGAYQETLGDLHNLFGDTDAAHVSVGDHGEVTVDSIVRGDTVAEVLSYVRFDPEQLLAKMRNATGEAVEAELVTADEAARILDLYQSGLRDYTYLEELKQP